MHESANVYSLASHESSFSCMPGAVGLSVESQKIKRRIIRGFAAPSPKTV